MRPEENMVELRKSFGSNTGLHVFYHIWWLPQRHQHNLHLALLVAYTVSGGCRLQPPSGLAEKRPVHDDC
jgi:hypothetical protein